MKIFKVQQNSQLISHHQISFKGEFDKYAYISKQIEQERINNIRRNYEAHCCRIDENIFQKNNKLQSLKRQIDSMQTTISRNNNRIENLQQQSNNILCTVNQKKEQIKSFSNKIFQLSSIYLEEKKYIDNEIENDKIQKLKNIQDSFLKNLEMIRTGPKKLMIDYIVNPIILASYETERANIKNISFKTDTLNAEEQMSAQNAIFSWITTMTDTNYAQLDINNFDNTNEFINVLRKISLFASRAYEENGNMSVTFLENLAKLKLEDLNDANRKFLEKFLTREENDNPNILLQFGNLSKKILKNTISINIDKNFLNNQKVGLNSLLQDIINKRQKGVDLIKRI